MGPPAGRLPSVTAISPEVRRPRARPCRWSDRRPADTPSGNFRCKTPTHNLALECGFTRSCRACDPDPRPPCPRRALSYEHMFPWSTSVPLAHRARNALSLARSFLLLEDDYDVDWEVDQDEQGWGAARGRTALAGPEREAGYGATRPVDRHPHRTPLRARTARERRGQLEPAPQVCVCPSRGSAPQTQRADTPRVGSARASAGRPQATRM